MTRSEQVDVFISYAQSDSAAYAMPLERYLREAGIEAWIAPERIRLGDSYPTELVRAIEACRCFVIIVSEAVGHSVHVPRELTLALEAKKPLIGIKVDNGPIPEPVRYQLSGYHFLDTTVQRFEVCVQALIDQLRQQLGTRMEETPEGTITELWGLTQLEPDLVPLWRRIPGTADFIEFTAPEGKEFDDGTRNKRLAFAADVESVTIGRRELEHKTVSRRAVRLRRENGRVWLRRDAECRAPVHVGLDSLDPDQERQLVHDRPIRIGRVEGSFIDHRYHPINLSPAIVNGRPEQVLDERTGLLSRAGLARELAFAYRRGQSRTLVLLKGDSEDLEESCLLALALHADNPGRPVGRWERVATLLADTEEPRLDSVRRLAESKTLRAGYVRVPPDDCPALALLADATAALDRTQTQTLPLELVDLHDFWLSLRAPDSFPGEIASSDFRDIGIVAVEEYRRVMESDAKASERIERDLMVDLSRQLGRNAVFTRIEPGVLAFSGDQPAEIAARQVASRWRERGSIQGQVFEVDCQLAYETIPKTAVASLGERAKELAVAVADGVSAQGLPYPIAVHAHSALEETNPEAVLESAEHFRGATEQFSYIALCALNAAQQDAPILEKPCESWRELAEQIVPRMIERTDRVGELARSLAESNGRLHNSLEQSLSALADIGQTARSRQQLDFDGLRSAVKRVLLALKGLRRWTLVSVLRFERMDPFSDRKCLQYVDHSGPAHSGVRRQATLIRDMPLGPFVYLVRLSDAAAFPLEPFVRRRLCVAAQEHQLFLAPQPIYAGGQHLYRSSPGFEQREQVEPRQIPRSLRIG